jgi:hypothetical protein
MAVGGLVEVEESKSKKKQWAQPIPLFNSLTHPLHHSPTHPLPHFPLKTRGLTLKTHFVILQNIKALLGHE